MGFIDRAIPPPARLRTKTANGSAPRHLWYGPPQQAPPAKPLWCPAVQQEQEHHRVGKSTLMSRAIIADDADDPRDWATRPHVETIGVEFDNQTVDHTKFQICDTAGAERFRHALGYSTRNIQSRTYVCDASDLSSFDATKRLFDDGIHGSYPQAVVLVVNKMEAAVEGVAEAAEELRAHMQLAVDALATSCGRSISFQYSEVSLLDPPSHVM